MNSPGLHGSAAVLGGGSAGILAARSLASRGCAVTLIERLPRLGGLHTSYEASEYRFDAGTFVFSHDHEYFRAFPGTQSRFHPVQHTNSTLTPSGTLDAYPLSLRGYVR